MKPINLDTLSAKELKVIATEKGLEFAKNASAVEMRALLQGETPENTPPKEGEDAKEEGEPDTKEGETPESEETPRVDGEYIVVTPIKQSGKRYSPGEVIVLEDEEAKNLLSEGIIR